MLALYNSAVLLLLLVKVVVIVDGSAGGSCYDGDGDGNDIENVGKKEVEPDKSRRQ